MYRRASIVRKGADGEDGYSGFTMRDPMSGEALPTPLDAILREAGVRAVVVVGLATDYCVKATALDALTLGYEATLLRETMAAVDLQPGDGAARDRRGRGGRWPGLLHASALRHPE